jgi:TonB family protein
VFVDESSFLVGRSRLASAQGTSDLSELRRRARAAQPTAQRTAQRAEQAAARARQTAATASAAGAGCIPALIRLAIFIAFASYAYTLLARVPAVRDFARSLARGEQVDLAPVVNTIREWLDLPVDRPPGSSPSSAPPRVVQPDRASDPALSQGRVYDPGQPGITAPVLVQRVPARYPPEAQARRLQGTVVVRCVVEPDGTVSAANVTRSIDPNYGLDVEAINAVRQWRFEPGKRNGEPVRVAALVTVTFSLRDRPPASAPPR